jgi:ATP-binding cassette, subfamily B, multidrug efflux pump
LKNLKKLNHYIKKYPFHIFGGLVFIVLSNLFALYPAQATRSAIDYLERFSANPHVSIDYDVFLKLLGLIILTALIKGVFMFFMRQTVIVMSRRIEFDLKNDLFKAFEKLPLSFYKVNKTGDLMSRMSEDVGQVRNYLGPAIMYAMNLIVLFLLVIGVMLSIDIKLTLMVLLPLPFLSWGVYKVSNAINLQSRIIQEHIGMVSSRAQGAFSGIRIIKSFAREKAEEGYMESDSLQLKRQAYKMMKIDSWFSPIVSSLIGISTLLTIFVGGLRYINGHISLGNIAEFVIYVNMLTWPVTSVGWVSSIIQKAEASMGRLIPLLNEANEQQSGENKNPIFLSHSIEFNNVSFTYPESGILAVDNLSFFLPDGKTLGITGKTGSGKSTVALLLSGLYEPDEGQILIGGIPIQEIPKSLLRKELGIVQQDIFLFSESIRENILFGAGDSTIIEVDLINAASDAGLLKTIQNLPQKWETLIGERGVTLSGGQKQRLSLARALLKQPSILLLDDCFSAIDTKTENEILGKIRNRVSSSTSVLISHRVSTLIDADFIFVLNKGRLMESGTHQTLLSKNDIYAELVKSQAEKLSEPSLTNR